MVKLIHFTEDGLFCAQANIYIDPWRPVDNAIITHAHFDHARIGHRLYIAHKDCVPILKHRLGEFLNCQAVEYNQSFIINGVKISLHPAGHIMGSAQVRLEYKGEVWVVSGDYKLTEDGISTPYENIKCDVFITEATFGLPIFKWQPQQQVLNEINNWWAENSEQGKCSVLAGYALGKAQRIMQALDTSLGKIYAHSSIENINKIIKQQGLKLPKVQKITPDVKMADFKNALVMVPPSALNSLWLEKFQPCSVAVASGWMSLRRAKRRLDIDKGFVISDHADWNQLKDAVLCSGAKKVYITHGNASAFTRWLSQKGIEYEEVETQFEGEMAERNTVYS